MNELNKHIYTESQEDKLIHYNTSNANDLKILKEKYKIEVIGKQSNSVYVHTDFNTNAMVKFVIRGIGNKIYIGKPINNISKLKLYAEFHQDNSTLIIADQHHWPIKLSLI